MLNPSDLDPSQAALWGRVQELWRAVARREAEALRAALHPRFTGWERDSPMPHDREFTVVSNTQHESDVSHVQLQPMRIDVFDDAVGIVHYYFRVLIRDEHAGTRTASGRWTETYLRKGENWPPPAAHGGSHGS